LRLLAAGAAVAHDGALSFAPAGQLATLVGRGAGARFPLTDVVTLHRQWPDAEIAGYLRLRGARAIGPAIRAAGALGRRPGFRRWVDSAAGGLRRTAATPCGQFDVTVAAEGADGMIRGVGRVADIYEMTSRAALHVTETLLIGDVTPGFRATGEVIRDPRATAESVGITLDLDRVGTGATQS
jgi:hypothetical protein